MSEYEQATITAFVVRKKRKRFLSFVANAKSRDKFVRELAHFRWFDARRVYDDVLTSPVNLTNLKQSLMKLLRFLSREGRTNANCWAADLFFCS